MPTHQEMLNAIADNPAAWRACCRRYWQLKSIQEAVRLTYETMFASQQLQPRG